VLDRGIWATWYDLDPAHRAEFSSWLHGECLPHLAQRSDFLWAAHYDSVPASKAMSSIRADILGRPDEDVGSGTQHLMLVGAETPHAFLDPLALEADFGGGARFAEMLALRQGVRTLVLLEEHRVEGPATADRDGLLPAPAIQLGSLRMRTVESEFDIGRWYVHHRLPNMARTPGCVTTRKFLSIAGWAKHAVLYEFRTLEDRMRHFEEAQEARALDPAEWTGRIARSTVHAPGSPTVATRTWPPVG
jgi:hypothetical protein